MFKLGAAFAIHCGRSPLVGPSDTSWATLIEHGFDGKGDIGLENACRFVVPEVQHIGSGVKDRVNAVATKIAHDAVSSTRSNVFDDAANLLHRHARFANFDGGVESLVSSADKIATMGVDFADEKGFGAVAVITIVVECDVDVDDVAVDEGGGVRNAVANNLVD